MNKVTSGQFQREYGLYRSEALKGGIIITHHGRDDLAVIPAEEYERLLQLDQKAYFAHELPEHIVEGFGTEEIPAEAQAFEDEYQGQ